MTHAQIHQHVKRILPAELLERYDHLSYAQMAEVEELAPWSRTLLWADHEWEKSNERDAVLVA